MWRPWSTTGRRFTSGRIFTGTYEDQVARLNYFSAGTNLGDRLPRAGWLAWDPGTDSLVYDWIISAFADFAARYCDFVHIVTLGPSSAKV